MGNAKFEFDIDNYLSEEEKKEIAIDVFRSRISNEMFKTREGSVQSDSEIQRIVGNITMHIVMEEVQKHIPDYKTLVSDGVKRGLEKADFNYYIFKKKDEWESKEGLGTTYMNEVIAKQKDAFQSKIKDAIMRYDCSDDISKEISNEFGEMADTIYKLSELFINKSIDK